MFSERSETGFLSCLPAQRIGLYFSLPAARWHAPQSARGTRVPLACLVLNRGLKGGCISLPAPNYPWTANSNHTLALSLCTNWTQREGITPADGL